MTLIKYFLLFNLFMTSLLAHDTIKYPAHWWEPFPREDAYGWEILPQDAKEGEVILSKRNELGLLSNLAHTPFVFRGKQYESVEGLWQSMKYPENENDVRTSYPGTEWIFTRDEVEQKIGFDAMKAGGLAGANMKIMGIDWVTFEGKRMKYWTQGKGVHYKLIAEILEAKIRTNKEVRDVLMATGDLILKPDHIISNEAPPAWRYYKIYMEIRKKLQAEL